MCSNETFSDNWQRSHFDIVLQFANFIHLKYVKYTSFFYNKDRSVNGVHGIFTVLHGLLWCWMVLNGVDTTAVILSDLCDDNFLHDYHPHCIITTMASQQSSSKSPSWSSSNQPCHLAEASFLSAILVRSTQPVVISMILVTWLCHHCQNNQNIHRSSAHHHLIFFWGERKLIFCEVHVVKGAALNWNWFLWNIL